MATSIVSTRRNRPDDQTSPSIDSLGNYLRAISHEVLTHEQAAELAKRIQAGDQAAFWHLYNANLLLVVSIAKRYGRGNGLRIDARIAAGNLGLYKAVKGFDPTKGAFSTYAAWWVKRAISEATADECFGIRIKQEVFDHMRRISDLIWDYELTHGKPPSDRWLAKTAGLGVSVIKRVRQALLIMPLSLNLPVDADEADGAELMDRIADTTPAARNPETEAVNRVYSAKVRTCLNQLSERERRVLECKYDFTDGRGEKWTGVAIAKVLGISAGRVSQIEDTAKAKLEQLLLQGPADKTPVLTHRPRNSQRNRPLRIIELRLLRFLADPPAATSTTPSDLSKRFGTSLWTTITYLAERGLVVRHVKTDAKPIETVAITPYGRHVLETTPRDFDSVVRELF